MRRSYLLERLMRSRKLPTRIEASKWFRMPCLHKLICLWYWLRSSLFDFLLGLLLTLLSCSYLLNGGCLEPLNWRRGELSRIEGGDRCERDDCRPAERSWDLRGEVYLLKVGISWLNYWLDLFLKQFLRIPLELLPWSWLAAPNLTPLPSLRWLLPLSDFCLSGELSRYSDINDCCWPALLFDRKLLFTWFADCWYFDFEPPEARRGECCWGAYGLIEWKLSNDWYWSTPDLAPPFILRLDPPPGLDALAEWGDYDLRRKLLPPRTPP